MQAFSLVCLGVGGEAGALEEVAEVFAFGVSSFSLLLLGWLIPTPLLLSLRTLEKRKRRHREEEQK